MGCWATPLAVSSPSSTSKRGWPRWTPVIAGKGRRRPTRDWREGWRGPDAIILLLLPRVVTLVAMMLVVIEAGIRFAISRWRAGPRLACGKFLAARELRAQQKKAREARMAIDTRPSKCGRTGNAPTTRGAARQAPLTKRPLAIGSWMVMEEASQRLATKTEERAPLPPSGTSGACPSGRGPAAARQMQRYH